MSVQELRARIARLDTEIDLQREMLKKLERDKSLVQRQLNAAVDPVARLPLELSSEIFLQSLPPFPELGAPHIPILLLNICHAWSDIALSATTLWTNFRIISPCAQGLKEQLLPIWLERAHNHPLSISLEGHFESDVVTLILKYGQQLKHLEISIVDVEDRDKFRFILEDPSWGPLSLLETLTIRGAQWPPRWVFPLPAIFQLLRRAPSLIEFGFHNTMTSGEIDSHEDLLLPTLLRLTFGERGTYADDTLLRYLSLPRLEALSTSLESDDHLLSFLKRSQPPLLELVLGWGPSSIDSVALVRCLRLVPDLKKLDIWPAPCDGAEELFSELVESSSLLPYLHTLSIHLEWSDLSDSFWPTSIRALAARRTQLKIFHLTVRYPADMPAPDILAAFREAARDATQVSIECIAPFLS